MTEPDMKLTLDHDQSTDLAAYAFAKSLDYGENYDAQLAVEQAVEIALFKVTGSWFTVEVDLGLELEERLKEARK